MELKYNILNWSAISYRLLIVPYGIEMEVPKRLSSSGFLLIVPYGIEIYDTFARCGVYSSF